MANQGGVNFRKIIDSANEKDEDFQIAVNRLKINATFLYEIGCKNVLTSGRYRDVTVLISISQRHVNFSEVLAILGL